MSAAAAPAPLPDEHQLAVIESRARTIRLVAPAGSGKTGTIVGRVLRRLDEGVRPERILLLTFDRSAAAGLAERLSQAAGGRRVPVAATLNAFGYRFLRDRLPAERAPVASARTCAQLAFEALAGLERASPARRRALPPRVDPATCVGLFSLLKNAVLDPRDLDVDRLAGLLLTSRSAAAFLPLDGRRSEVVAAIEAIAWLFRRYDAAMRRSGRIDFDDQKLRACLALAGSPRLARETRGIWDEVIVDEFQDVNRLDFELVRRISTRAVLLVAGDDDQAIYGFRGCTAEFIVNLERHTGRVVASYELSHNYRSPPEILQIADRLIRHNRGRIPKRPVARRPAGAEISVARHDGVEEEADAVAEWVGRAVRADGPGGRWEDVAVLVRLHAQAVPLREAFGRRGLPAVVDAPPPGPWDDPVASPPPAGRGVAIRTYFKAKGSQWPSVVLVGCSEGVVPHGRAPVEDERRLFYVGLTRASRRLLVSCVAPARGGPRPSRFLREAGLAVPEA